jgi:hypothetical protein
MWERLCRYFVLYFALWTIVCNVITVIAESLQHVLVAFALINLVIGYWLWKKRKTHRDERISHTVQREQSTDSLQQLQPYLFRGLLIVSVCLSLITHRPDQDDAHYINVAVASVDNPNLPILRYDTTGLFPHAPLLVPAYKMHSIEILVAALSFVTHIPAIYLFHFLLPTLGAILTITAYRELFRLLSPKYWGWGILGVFVFLCANADVHRTYGNFSFVRLHQGKGMLVSVVLPLIILYGLRYASRPNIRNWVLLAGAQITAVGMTSTALWIAPTVASLAVFAGMPKIRLKEQCKRVLFGMTTSAYLIGLGSYMRLAYPMPLIFFTSQLTAIHLVKNSITAVFGYTRFGIMCIVLVLTAWSLCENRITRRLCLVFPICVAVIFGNPLIANILATYVTSEITYWRFFWILPLPTIAGLTLTVPLSSTKLRLNASARHIIYFLGLLGMMLLPKQYIFSQSNHVDMNVPHLKVDPEYQIAVRIRNVLPNRPYILAPRSVTAWLTTLHQHPYPLTPFA